MQHTDTSENTKATLVRCLLAFASGCHMQHIDTSKNTEAWDVSQHNDTSKNTKAWVVCRNILTPAGAQRLGLCRVQHTDTTKKTEAWAVSQHSETSKNTKAWAVSQHTDTSKNTKATLVWDLCFDLCLCCVHRTDTTCKRTSMLGLCHNTLAPAHQSLGCVTTH